MPIILLVLAILSAGFYNIFSDVFASRNIGSKKSELLFNLLICVTACCCWGIYWIFDRSFDPSIIPYALGFGAAVFVVFFFTQLALKNGQVSLVTLIILFSLIIVAIYGFIFWGSSFSIFKIIGLILVTVSLFCIIYKKGSNKKTSILWLIFAVIAMVANAACSIIQKTEQINFSNMFGVPFMVIATLFASLLSGILLIIKRKEVKVENFKRNWPFPIAAGIANFLLNLFVILLAQTDLSPTIVYPAISMSIIVVLIYSVFFKKERLTIMQIIGMALGIAAVLLLSI